ncbi:pseudouridine synthase [Shewanella sp.]|nr:pseudouridine synthase [Shewanella sp.]
MNHPVRARQASSIVLPESITDKPTVLSFLVSHFSAIAEETWIERIKSGKVHWRNGDIIQLDTAFVARARVYYYREVEQESVIPFDEKTLLTTPQFIIAYKPAFLAVNPSGNFVNECLVNRLRMKTKNEQIVACHRLDRATAGVMLLSVNPETRHDYHQLFKTGHITKTYQAIARLCEPLREQMAANRLTLPLHWTVKNRLVKAEPSFMMKISHGEANSHSEITLVQTKGDLGLFQLQPITGRTHQLRLHMLSLGMPIMNDKLYPLLQDKAADDFNQPLMLLAKTLRFVDPITEKLIDVSCEDLHF